MFGAFPTIADFSVLDFELWVFILIRVSFMAAFLPVISSSQVPTTVKVSLAVFLSFIIFNVMPERTVELPENLPGLVWLALKELYIGMVIALSTSAVFAAVDLAGEVIDTNAGFAMIQSVNPMTDENEAISGQLQVILFSLILIVTGGHLVFIRIAAESFSIIPLLQVSMDHEGIAWVFIAITTQSFVYGVKLAAPVVVTLLLTTAALALISKIMPQMNIWLVGMPLKILVGLGTLSFTLPMIWEVFKKYLYQIEVYQVALLRLMGN